jgi:hypothetical protein
MAIASTSAPCDRSKVISSDKGFASFMANQQPFRSMQDDDDLDDGQKCTFFARWSAILVAPDGERYQYG